MFWASSPTEDVEGKDLASRRRSKSGVKSYNAVASV